MAQDKTVARERARVRHCENPECRRRATLNEAGDCPVCAVTAERVVERIAAGTLPRINLRLVGDPRTAAVLVDRQRARCVVCDREIHGEHFAYRHDPSLRGERGVNLHFHHLCHVIWRREAAFVP
jgi:hypothetical protein